MRPLKIAIIGYGKIAEDQHVPSIQANKRFELVGTSSRSGQGVGQKFTDWRELIRTVEGRGGRYFTADTAGQLAEVGREIDALEKGLLVSTRYVYDTPAFETFGAAAVVLICAALLLRTVPYFVDLT